MKAALEELERASRERFQALIETTYPNRGRGHYDFAIFVERALTILRDQVSPAMCFRLTVYCWEGGEKLRILLFEIRRRSFKLEMPAAGCSTMYLIPMPSSSCPEIPQQVKVVPRYGRELYRRRLFELFAKKKM